MDAQICQQELLGILAEKEQEIEKLKAQIRQQEDSKKTQFTSKNPEDNKASSFLLSSKFSKTCTLECDEIQRFSRQIILPEIGVQGQLKLKSSAVLIVGAGGLGCPSALYLAAAGVGCIGFVDYDVVDMSNLHRQVLHQENYIGENKVTSAAEAVSRLNSRVKCKQHHCALNSSNALEIIRKYQIIIDATDNVATRYLLNDACVLSGKPLVSGSALKWEGQLTVYNLNKGPCYRCIFPKPPPPSSVTNCSEGGIIGAVTGVIGSLQAMEVIKILTQNSSSYRQKLLLFDAFEGCFRNVKLRQKRDDCAVCGVNPTVRELQDYTHFCGAAPTDKERELTLLRPEDRITVEDLRQILEEEKDHILLDIRPREEYEICSLKGSMNVPLRLIEEESDQFVSEILRPNLSANEKPVYVICRRGNDSQKAVCILKDKMNLDNVRDVKGGLQAWSKAVDVNFPKY